MQCALPQLPEEYSFQIQQRTQRIIRNRVCKNCVQKNRRESYAARADDKVIRQLTMRAGRAQLIVAQSGRRSGSHKAAIHALRVRAQDPGAASLSITLTLADIIEQLSRRGVQYGITKTRELLIYDGERFVKFDPRRHNLAEFWR